MALQRLYHRIRDSFLSRYHGEVREGAASIRKLGTNPQRVITVGLRLVGLGGKRGFFLTHLQASPRFDFTKECLEFYHRARFSTSKRNVTSAFEGYGIDGFARAGTYLFDSSGGSDRRLRDYGLVLTRLEGINLQPDWGHGAEIASALACFRALGEPRTTKELGITGWEEIGFGD